MINPIQKIMDAKKLRLEKINQAREGFTSWLDISKSKGWWAYQEMVDKKIENVKKQMEENTSLDGEELKRLQLALAVWNEVLRIPKILEERAKGGN